MPGTCGGEPLMSGLGGKRKKKSNLMEALIFVMPSLEWVPEYQRAFLQPDVAGGITLGCILVAQSLAHAALSNVQLINGPYSCILPPALYAIFGTCVHSSVGTGGLVALLTGEQLVQYTAPSGSGWASDVEYRTHVGAILTAEVGMILALMGICKLAFLVRFLSRPALSGFITASAVLIIVSQMAGAIGLPEDKRKGGLVNVLVHHYQYLSLASIPATCLSTVAMLYLMRAKSFYTSGVRMCKQVRVLKPLVQFKELVLLVGSAAVAWQWNARLGGRGGLSRIEVIGSVPSGLPMLQFPVRSREDLDLAQRMLPGAGLIALVVFLSSFAGAKKFAMKDGYQVRAFNELLALGMANLGGAFMGAVPTQIGLSRMGIAHGAGVKTQMGANVFVAVVVALAVQCCSPALYEVPRCVLNCIIMSGASHLTEFEEAKLLWTFFSAGNAYDYKARLDIVTWMSGFLCTLYFGAFKGILIAVFISLALIVYQVVEPSINELAYKDRPHVPASRTLELPEDDHQAKPRARKWVELSSGDKDIRTEPGILVYRMDGPLFYANFERMQEWLEEKLVTNQEEASEENHYHTIILSASSIPWLDSTAVQGLLRMVECYQAREPPLNFFIAQTFGTTKTILEDKVMGCAYCKVEGLGDGLKDLVAEASSIDDFVQIANAKLPELTPMTKRERVRSFRSSRWVKENLAVPNPTVGG